MGKSGGSLPDCQFVRRPASTRGTSRSTSPSPSKTTTTSTRAERTVLRGERIS